MKPTRIAIATSLAFAALSAQAAGPTLPATLTTIYGSGSNGSDAFVKPTVLSLLTPLTGQSSVITFRDSGGTTYGYIGKGVTTVPSIKNKNILFIKRGLGAAIYGVNPVARAERIQVPDLTNCTDNTASSGFIAGTDPFQWICSYKGIDKPAAGWNDALANSGRVPDFGITDVEPAIFKGPYGVPDPVNDPALSATELAKLKIVPTYQMIEAPTASDSVPATTYLSQADYAALLTHKVNDWSEIDSSLSGPVTVCNRVGGAAHKNFYLPTLTGFGCTTQKSYGKTLFATTLDSAGYDYLPHGATNASNVTANTTTLVGDGSGVNAANPIWIDPTAGYTVFEGLNTSDARNCLKNANSHTNLIAQGRDNKWYGLAFGNSVTATKAVGVISGDNLGKESGWHFRTLDGAGQVIPVKTGTIVTDVSGSSGYTGLLPTKANVLSGKYPWVIEGTVQYRKVQVVNRTGDTVAPLSANAVKLGFVTELAKRLGSPEYTGGKNGDTTNPVPAAYASIPQSGVYDPLADPLYVSKYTRELDSCSPLHRY